MVMAPCGTISIRRSGATSVTSVMSFCVKMTARARNAGRVTIRTAIAPMRPPRRNGRGADSSTHPENPVQYFMNSALSGLRKKFARFCSRSLFMEITFTAACKRFTS